MSKTMPKTTEQEKLRWIKPILDKEISIKDMALVCPFSERSLKYWISNYRSSGMTGLINRSTKPKSHPSETPIRIKERVIEIRRETRLCAQKIHWRLAKESINIHPRTIHKIIKNEGLVRKYRTRKVKPLKKKSFVPGELVEVDIKYVPKRLKNKRYYQFTAIDSSSRWRYLKLYDEMSNSHAIELFY